MIRLPGLLLLLLATLPAGEVRVEAVCPWLNLDGYTPVQVRVEALIAPVEMRLEVEVGAGRAVDVLRAQPGQVVMRTVLVPTSGDGGAPRLRWTSSGGSGGEDMVSPEIDFGEVDLVLLDPRERVPLPALQTLLDGARSHGGYIQVRGRYYGSGSGNRARRLAVEALPDRWQAWPHRLTLLTTAEGEALLSPAQREAIAGWTRCGGAVFTTEAAAVERWRRLGVAARLIRAEADKQPELLARIGRATVDPGTPNDHPVPGTDEVPTAWFLVLAIAFAIVAGPLNLWWALRRRRPWLLLVSTPLISIGTCLLLIIVALLADGLGRARSAAQITVLDVDRQRTTVFTAVTWFCGLAPGPFDLDPEDRIMPMDAAEWSPHGRYRSPVLGLDWRLGQRADGGWIPARVNRQIAFTQLRPERRRLAVQRVAGGWRVANGLDATLVEFRWSGPDGSAWVARDVAPGAEAPLTPAQAAGPDLGRLLARLGGEARLVVQDNTGKPGDFLARLDRPLWPIPGPEAEDAAPVEAWVAGQLGGGTAGPEGF